MYGSKIILSLFILMFDLQVLAKPKRFDGVECDVTQQTYGSVLECGEELFAVKKGSAVEKSLNQICKTRFKCQISFEVNNRDEVTKILSAFTKGKKKDQTFATSFDCKKAHNSVEKIICTNEDLAKLDNQLGAEIKKALETAESTIKVRDRQKAWIKEKRNVCKDRECLLEAYQKRLHDMTGP